MIKKIFWNGLQAFVPIVVTLAIVVWLFTSIEAFFGRFLQYFIPDEYYFDGLGIVVGIVLVFIIGVLVNAWLINRIYVLADKIVKKIPLIKVLYNSIQELMQFFNKNKDNQGKQTVLVSTAFGQVLGFVTRQDLSSLPDVLGGQEKCLVYVPLSYQIGGLMLAVNKDDLEPIAWDVNQAMSFVLTGGMSSVPSKKPGEKAGEKPLQKS